MTTNELRQILADAFDGAAERLRAGIAAAGAEESNTVRPAISEPLADVTKAVFSVEEVAILLELSRSSVYESVRTGNIPSIRVGRRLLVPTHALRGWLAKAEG